MKKSPSLAKRVAPVLAAAALIYGANAAAQAVVGLDVTGSGGTTNPFVQTDLWTNVTDSALAIGFDPTRIVPPDQPYQTTLTAQARLGTTSLGPTVNTPAGVNSSWEITETLKALELVVKNDGTNANFTAAPGQSGGTPELSIYLDNSPDAVPGDGTGTVSGYTDGVLIATLQLESLTASFAAQGAIGTGSFDLRFRFDQVNSNYLDVASGTVIGTKITGTTNVPSQFFPDVMWDGTPTANGLLLKVDSSLSFRAGVPPSVPEPATLGLLGIGLLALGFGRYRASRNV